MFKKMLIVIAGMLLIGALPAHAGSQQDKMKSCNADAKQQQLKGDARKTFMKSCLSAKPASAASETQQQKMKSCNADAKTKELKGDDRKTYMKQCLSTTAAP